MSQATGGERAAGGAQGGALAPGRGRRRTWDLRFRDPRRDPAGWARRLQIPLEAVELYLQSDVIDLHCCSFIWSRFGYDLSRRHRPLFGVAPALNQVDFPRAREAGLTGIVWDITTNPFRTARGRARAFFHNLARLRRLIERHPNDLRLVASAADYRRARRDGLLACQIGVQGGNALDASLELLERLPDGALSRVTLVHFTRSRIGVSSALTHARGQGLSPFGREFVAALAAKRVFVDLSHINRAGFFDALDALPPGVPALVTHTGVQARRSSFRNIDDEQIRAVAATGGTIGIIYQGAFIGPSWRSYGLREVVDHMEHVIRVAGEDHLSLGSDYDGVVILPRDLPDVTAQPRIVAEMLRRGWSAERIGKVLGGNYLRALEAVRPGA